MMELDPVDASLAQVRAELSPNGADKARLRAALGLPPRGSAPFADSPTAGPLRAASAPSFLQRVLTQRAALRASGKLGASLAALLFGAGVAVGLQWQAREPVSVPAVPTPTVAVPAAASAEPAVEKGEASPPSVLAPPPPAHAEAGARHVRPRATPRPRAQVTSPLATELGLLRRVERALRNNDPALAVALLGELDERFPQTRLAEERLAARRMAECRLGSPDAVTRARAFLREHSASVYSERVQLACALETNAAAAPR